MPYDIRQDGEGGKPWCVYLQADGSKLGCTDTEEKAKAMIAAIEASEHSIKATDGAFELDVLGVPHGRDRQGQLFDARTDLGLLSMVPVVYWHGFDQQNQPRVETIGWAVKSKRDDQGQWYRVTLDRAKEIARKIYEDAVKGLVRASSDAIAHLVRPVGILGKPGYVSSWPVAALSLMDAATFETAVNPRAIAMPAVRAMFDEALSTLEQALPSGEADLALAADDAVKAGAVFARRNRERIKKMRELLDEMASEFPAEDAVAPDDAGAATIAAVTGNQETQTLSAAKAGDETAGEDILGLDHTFLSQMIGRMVADAVSRRRNHMEQLK